MAIVHHYPHHEFQRQLDEAIAASEDEFAFQLQLQEVIALSDFTFAQELQLQEVLAASDPLADDGHPVPSASTSTGNTAATFYLEQESKVVEISNEIDRWQLHQALAASGLSFASGSSVTCPPIQENSSRSFAPSTSAGLVSVETIRDAFDQQQEIEIPKKERREGKQPLLSSAVSSCATSCYSNISTPLTEIKLCPICLEPKTPTEIFKVSNCFHEFCISCMIQHVHHSLQEKKFPIRCVGAFKCDQPLTPEYCQAFLPKECYDAWRVAIIEAEIPDEHKVYCPFPDCSGLLVKEEGHDISTAECPFCNRLFCVHCMVPWHAGIECSKYQMLSVDDRTRTEDLMLHVLAEQQRWQRCQKCHRIIELTRGCNHITCRCGHEFCYVCGSQWTPVHTCVPQLSYG